MEYAWSKTENFRNIDEKRDGMYPAFRRIDAKNWAKWKFYPGAITMFLTRLILLSVIGTSLVIFIKVLTMNHNFRKDGPIKDGLRKRMIH